MFERTLERSWSEDRGSEWNEVPESPGNHELNYLQEASEHEIFSDAFGDRDEPDWDEREANDALIEEMSQSEGIDGRPLPMAEIAHRNLYGDDPTGTDRPLERQYELAVDAENAELRAENQRLRAEQHATVNQYSPEVESQRRLARDAFLDQHGLLTLDDAKADALFTQMAQWQARSAELENARVRDSIDAQRAEWGDRAVDLAIAAFKRLDQSQPMARAIDQHVYGSSNPGETFMALVHNSDAVASMGRGPWRGSSRPSRNTSEDDNAGAWGDEEFERDIADSAWR
jgi:hypothetical protein